MPAKDFAGTLSNPAVPLLQGDPPYRRA
jgi:hypothetical protein